MTAPAGVERDIAIVACAVSAGVHAALAPEHLEDGVLAGAGFAGSALALTVVAVALTRGSGRIAVAAAATMLGGLLASYAVVATTGLPLVHPEPEPVEPIAVFTKAVEALGLAACALLLRRARPVARPIPVGLAALIAVFTSFAALALTSGHAGHG